MSAATADSLYRVGAVLAVAEGGYPNDDPWLRRYLEDGRAEGLAQGRSEGRYESVVAVLQARGIVPSTNLPARLAGLGATSVDAMVSAALRCASEREFLELCAGERE